MNLGAGCTAHRNALRKYDDRMPFPEKYLNSNENKVLDLHPHWWFMAPPAATLFGALVLGVWVSNNTSGWLKSFLGFIALAAIVVSAAWLIKRAIEWRVTYFVVTNERIIYQEGIGARNRRSITLDKINDIQTKQNIFERLIDAGDVRIESGGEDGMSVFTDISRPLEVQNIINHIMSDRADSARGFAAAPSAGGQDVVSQLERLEALLERGTITHEEFEIQKRRLID